jgi:hypothetical protein
VAPFIDAQRAFFNASISASDDVNLPSLQPLDQSDNRRRLAGSAGIQVPDTDNGDSRRQVGRLGNPASGSPGIETSKGRQKPGLPTRPVWRIVPEPRRLH